MCQKCDANCLTCRTEGYLGCTACKQGSTLQIVDAISLTGKCNQLAGNATIFNKTVYVTGIRGGIQGQNSDKFPDLLSALKYSYGLKKKNPNLENVLLLVNPAVTHSVIPADFEALTSLIEAESTISTNYTLDIM